MKEIMTPELIIELVGLGGTVVVVGLFLWYLRDRNGKQDAAMKGVADTLKEINQSQERHTRVLMRVANKSGLKDDADELMKD